MSLVVKLFSILPHMGCEVAPLKLETFGLLLWTVLDLKKALQKCVVNKIQTSECLVAVDKTNRTKTVHYAISILDKSGRCLLFALLIENANYSISFVHNLCCVYFRMQPLKIYMF